MDDDLSVGARAELVACLEAAPKFPDRLQRDFTAPAPNVKWCGDMTEIPTDEGKLYRPGPVLPQVAGQPSAAFGGGSR